MTREQAIRAYERVKAWERSATMHLLQDMHRQGACDPIPLTLHNWGYCAGQEPYRRLHREYEYRQRRIWDTTNRLRESFARYF